jgi:predicted nucleic acid-binding protein
MSGILVDTSVWIDHFRRPNAKLIRLLSVDLVMTHPMVLGELACGTPPAPRARTLNDVGLLRQTQQASIDDVLDFVELEKLYGLGCGLIDITLLASTLLTPGTQLWTLDRHLGRLAQRFAVSH